MSGVYVIVALLKASAGVTAIVPASRIMAGELPLNTPLPAIGVSLISSMPTNYIQANSAPKMHTDRVQVSVLCKETSGSGAGIGYGGVQSLLRLVLAACPNQRGTINGIIVDSIVPDIAGPDSYDDVDLVHQGSRDFLVRYLF